MALIAEFTIPASALPGDAVLEEMPNARLELERIVPTTEKALPFFWLWSGDPDAFLERFAEEPEIADLELLEEVENGALLRADWTPHADVVLAIDHLDATVIEAVGQEDTWRFQIRATDRDRFAEFQRVFDQRDIPVHLERLLSLAELADQHHPLTPTQRETLLAAYEEGYFADSRQVSQAELGDHFGVSDRAIGQRLRRGIRNLVGSTIAVDHAGEHAEE